MLFFIVCRMARVIEWNNGIEFLQSRAYSLPNCHSLTNPFWVTGTSQPLYQDTASLKSSKWPNMFYPNLKWASTYRPIWHSTRPKWWPPLRLSKLSCYAYWFFPRTIISHNWLIQNIDTRTVDLFEVTWLLQFIHSTEFRTFSHFSRNR